MLLAAILFCLYLLLNGIKPPNLKKVKNTVYDYIFLGTGIISILEAVYQERCGKKVLMIDKDSDIGGAWQPIDIFNLEDVENAIHYFLYDYESFLFMRNNLGWNIIETEKKLRLLSIFSNRKYLKFKFNNPIGRFISYMINDNGSLKKNNLKYIFRIVNKIRKEHNQKSFYIKEGTKKIFNTAKNLLDQSKVVVLFKTHIKLFNVDRKKKMVELSSENQTFRCRQLIITHGSRIGGGIKENNNLFNIDEKHHPRPAVHLLVKDPYISPFKQWIFINHNLIKYAHDITDISNNTKKGHKILVFGLKHEIKESNSIYQKLVDELIKAKILSEKAELSDSKWTDVHLPTLYDEDLENIKSNFYPYIDFLKTENFSRGIGLYSKKWSSKI